MAYSINTEPLLKEDRDGDFEDDFDTDIDDTAIVHSHEEPFIKHQIPYDR